MLVPAVALLTAVAVSAPAAASGAPRAAVASPAAATAGVPAPAAPRATDPLPDRLRGKDVTTLGTKKKLVALTFDAGGGAGGVASILRTLKREKVPATFFLTGRWARVYPDLVEKIAARGFVLGNHTDSHPHVPQLSTARLKAEVKATDRAVRAAAGRGTKPFFRFPYGDRRSSDITRLNDLGYLCVRWTVDTAGWLGTSGGQSVSTVLSRVLRGLQPGEIILMHVGQHPTDGSTLDADALPRIISELRARGYGFTTVEALVDPKAAATSR